MTNISALYSLCNAIANTFYPDESTLKLALFNAEIDPDGAATPKDPSIFRVAVALVRGYIEGSRSENGVSTSVLQEAIDKSLNYWCNYYGLDPDEELGNSLTFIEDGSPLW